MGRMWVEQRPHSMFFADSAYSSLRTPAIVLSEATLEVRRTSFAGSSPLLRNTHGPTSCFSAYFSHFICRKRRSICTYPAIIYAEGTQNTPGIQMDTMLFHADRTASVLPFSAPESGPFLFLDSLLYYVFSEMNAQISVIFMRPVKVSCSPSRVWKNAQKHAIII